MKRYQLIGVIFVISSCHGSVKKTDNALSGDTLLGENITTIVEPNNMIKSTHDSIEVATVAMSFYNWYLHGKKPKDWRVDASLNADSTVSLRNSDTYLNLLEKLGTLSKRFMEREKERLNQCNQFLLDNDWSDADHGSMYAYAEGPCEWFAYDYWFHSQETPDEAQLVNLDIRRDTASADIDFYIHASDGKFREYYSVKEFLILTANREWRIDSISILIQGKPWNEN
jgi:hypothetical protein